MKEQTLEKTLTHRMQKVHQLIKMMADCPGYYPQEPKESLSDLIHLLEEFDTTSSQCQVLLSGLEKTADQRQKAFQGSPHTVRNLSTAIQNEVENQFGKDSSQSRFIKGIYTKIINQFAHPLPDNLLRAGAERSVTRYESAYLQLTQNFQALINALTDIQFTPQQPVLAEESLLESLARAIELNEKTKALYSQLLEYHQRRISLYRQIKEQVKAIVERTRLLFGSNDPLYQSIRVIKL